LLIEAPFDNIEFILISTSQIGSCVGVAQIETSSCNSHFSYLKKKMAHNYFFFFKEKNGSHLNSAKP